MEQVERGQPKEDSRRQQLMALSPDGFRYTSAFAAPISEPPTLQAQLLAAPALLPPPARSTWASWCALACPQGSPEALVRSDDTRGSAPVSAMATFGAPCPPGAPGRLKRVLVWLRRDLRVADHPALAAALALAEEVVSGRGQCACGSDASCTTPLWGPAEAGQGAARLLGAALALRAARHGRLVQGHRQGTNRAAAPPAPQVPVFIWAPEEEGQFQPGRCLRWWLHSSLRALEADFAALGSRIVYAKAPESRIALLQLVRDVGAQGVLFNHLYDPISMVRAAGERRLGTRGAKQRHLPGGAGSVTAQP